MIAATQGGRGDTRGRVGLPFSLRRKTEAWRGGWALVRPLPHLPGAGGWPAACGWSQAARECQQPTGVCVCVCELHWIHPASGTAERSL